MCIRDSQNGNTAAFEFNRLIVFTDGIGELAFYNPGNSTQDIVVKLTISDQELIDKLGVNHRTFLDQKRLEVLGEYDPETYRQDLAVSGRVPAGSRLETLTLNALQDGTDLPPGTYKGIIELDVYKRQVLWDVRQLQRRQINQKNRSMNLNSQPMSRQQRRILSLNKRRLKRPSAL